MKKWIVAAIVLLGLSAVSVPQAQAQFYSGYTYNNNAYMNYAMASQRAKATRNKARSAKRNHRKKARHTRRHARR